jgi:hypothetical protein
MIKVENMAIKLQHKRWRIKTTSIVAIVGKHKPTFLQKGLNLNIIIDST